MNIDYTINQLENNLLVFRNIFSEIPDEVVRWHSASGKWSLLEIACHLYDEEREDFRTRLKQVMEDPSLPFPKIDPQAWVQTREYALRDIKITVDDFLKEREESVKWLRTIQNELLDNAYVHPKFGPLSGKMLLTNWLAHDYLHIRQIVKVKYDYLSFSSGEKLDYAGTW